MISLSLHVFGETVLIKSKEAHKHIKLIINIFIYHKK
jgi:hypothetical protein